MTTSGTRGLFPALSMAVFSQRKCDGYYFYFETKETIEFADKAEGNEFFRKVSATKKTSKRGSYYYRY